MSKCKKLVVLQAKTTAEHCEHWRAFAQSVFPLHSELVVHALPCLLIGTLKVGHP